jgi:hypothetical protein
VKAAPELVSTWLHELLTCYRKLLDKIMVVLADAR